jgi:type II secretory pathway pseudopilin PulG
MTLLELMTVVVVLGAMTALSALSFMSVRTTARSRETTRKLVMAMRSARIMAVTTGLPHGVYIGTSSDSLFRSLLVVFRKDAKAMNSYYETVPTVPAPDVVIDRSSLPEIGFNSAARPELLHLDFDFGGAPVPLNDGESLEIVFDADGRPSLFQVPTGGGIPNNLTAQFAPPQNRLVIKLQDPREFRGTATRNPTARCTELSVTGSARTFNYSTYPNAPFFRWDCV